MKNNKPLILLMLVFLWFWGIRLAPLTTFPVLIFIFLPLLTIFIFGINLFFATVWLLGKFIFNVINKTETVGRKNFPKGYRICSESNHQTLLDSLLIAVSTLSFWEALFFPKRIFWNAADADNFFGKRLDRIIFGALKVVRVRRGVKTLAKIIAQVTEWVKILVEENLHLFIEGTRTRNGNIGECRYGVAKTILMADPNYIVPILLIDVNKIMPIESGSKVRLFYFTKNEKGKKRLNCSIKRGQKAKIIIGQPFKLANLVDLVGLANLIHFGPLDVNDSVKVREMVALAAETAPEEIKKIIESIRKDLRQKLIDLQENQAI